ncbi:unnamed protein product [Ectocarpus sp. 12 AP-2014]
MVTTADVENKMVEHFGHDLFSTLDIQNDSRLLRKLLQDLKVRYQREVKQQEDGKSKARVLSQDSTSSTPDAEVVEDPPMVASEVSISRVCKRSATAKTRAQ